MDQVLGVYRQCEDFLALGPVPQASQAMVEADLEHSEQAGGHFCGIFSIDGQMKGVVDFVERGFEGDPSAACLFLLMIGAPYRGQGLGAAVVGAVETWIERDIQVRDIHAGVQVNNPLAIRFWLRMGYEIVSGAEKQDDGTVAYHLKKHIGLHNGHK